MGGNGGRNPMGWRRKWGMSGAGGAGVQVGEEGGVEVLSKRRVRGQELRQTVFGWGEHTIRVGRDRPDGPSFSGVGVDLSGIGEKIEVRL